MRFSMTLLGALVCLLPLSAPAALASDLDPAGSRVGADNDLGAAAAELLETRCASCHGPESKDRKAIRGWADATDLAAAALDEDLMTVGDPEDSTLYFVIADGEMPPSDSEFAAFSEEETAVIEEWIRAGAPLPVPESADQPADPLEDGAGAVGEAPVDGSAPAATPKESSWMKRPLPKWLGRFHPMVVHFPLALLSVALLAELLAGLRKRDNLRTAATFCYTIGALSALPSAAFGWLLAASTSHHGDELFYHRWLGVALAALTLLLLRPFCTKPGLRLPILALLAALAGATGHLGGSLSYGSDWLDWPG
jgi:uncharacterized membrane protein/mono/diheme cytochrome c family protein